MIRDINLDYFDWLCEIVCGERYSSQISYTKLLMYLHDTEFRYVHPMDENRAAQGINLRYRFALTRVPIEETSGIMKALDAPCSILEMMIALAIECEETIMDNPSFGNRTSQWFWGMIASLGLGGMYNDRFDRAIADEIIDRFLNREYKPDGRGGLFTVKGYSRDMRDMEIWWQALAYLNGII